MSRGRSPYNGHDPAEGQGARLSTDAINRIEADAEAVERLTDLTRRHRHAVLTVNGIDRLVLVEPAAAFDVGFALKVEPLVAGLSNELAVILDAAGLDPTGR